MSSSQALALVPLLLLVIALGFCLATHPANPQPLAPEPGEEPITPEEAATIRAHAEGAARNQAFTGKPALNPFVTQPQRALLWQIGVEAELQAIEWDMEHTPEPPKP